MFFWTTNNYGVVIKKNILVPKVVNTVRPITKTLQSKAGDGGGRLEELTNQIADFKV